MTPHKQLNIHSPENGIYGDCFRTALACLLDMNPYDIPNFAEDEKFNKDEISVANEWLEKKGYVIISIAYPKEILLKDIMESMKIINPGIHYLLIGESRSGVDHNVICKNDKIVHDTSMDNSGIVGPAKEGYWWINFLGVKV